MAPEFKIYKDYYLKDRVKYTRITTVLDYFTTPHLLKWYLATPDHKGKSKSNKAIGTRVHNLVDDCIANKPIKLTSYDSPAIGNCLEAFKRWYQTEQPKVVGVEQTYFNEQYKIAGTIDIELIDRIIDIKTSERIQLKHWLQLAMYRFLKGEPLELYILRIDKFLGDYEYVKCPYDYDELVQIYLGLYRYYSLVELANQKGEDNGDNITDTEVNN